VLKPTNFVAVIDDVFCLDAHVCDIQTRDAISRHAWVEWDYRHL